MGLSRVAALAKAIGYPQEVPAETMAFDFVVDGRAVRARERDGRLLLDFHLPADADVARFATLATGRILKENAILAWDPEAGAAFLWRTVGLGETMRTDFEEFMNSVDWWTDRQNDETGTVRPSAREMVIRP